MEITLVSQEERNARGYWVEEIRRLSGDFGVDSARVEDELSKEVETVGITSLVGHLRLCGAIPEGYGHDSSEEKLYSKYTDVVIHEAYKAMGFTSLVLKERADVADVECVCDDYSFVADAKAFRLSRTAKNQKDFKVQAMDNWKHGKPFAMVVCPVYQLPHRNSQIYLQAASRSVLISTYTHLAVLARYADLYGQPQAIIMLHEMFQAVERMNPSKSAAAYWQVLNQALISTDDRVRSIWREEKVAALESIYLAQREALQFLARERERIMRLSREDAIREVLKTRKVENRIRVVKAVSYNGILEM